MTEPQIMIVTGGSRGIGAATARLAARRGYDLCVNYLGNLEGAEAVVRDVEAAGQRAIAVQADVSKEDQVERLFETVDSELGTLTALINNAGITGPSSRLDAVEAETLQRALDINVLAVMLCFARRGPAHVDRTRRPGRRHHQYFLGRSFAGNGRRLCLVCHHQGRD